MNSTAPIPTFFADGIPFECIHCGMCCTGRPGTVGIQPDEIEALAAFLVLSPADCIQHFLTPHEAGYRVRERANGDCIFFENGCSVHAVRPAQCRTYPFWIKNMRSPEAWQRTCSDCPGIGTGKRHSETEILHILHSSPL